MSRTLPAWLVRRSLSTGEPPPHRSGALAALLVLAELLVPLAAVGAAGNLGGSSLAACVPSSQVASTEDSFVAVPQGTNPGEVYAFDSTSGAQLGNPVTVGYDPIAMAVDTTYSQLYVLNQRDGSSDPTVSVIDYANGFSVVATITISDLATAEAIGVTPGGNHIVVELASSTLSGELALVNPHSLAVDATIAVSGDPSTLAFTSTVGSIYVGDDVHDDILIYKYTSTSPPYYTLQVSKPSGYHPVSMTTSGSTLYVGETYNNSDDVPVNDVAGFTMGDGTLSYDSTHSWSLPEANVPESLVTTPNGLTLYVGSDANGFLEVNTTSGGGTAGETAETAPTGETVGALAANSDGTIVEMADTAADQVDRWAVDENAAQDALTGLSGVPSAVASVPSSSLRFYAYVAQSASINSGGTGDVSVVDLLAGADIADLPVGVDPEYVLPSADGSSVYVADTGTGTNGSLDVIATDKVNTAGYAVPALTTTPGISFSAGAAPDALALSPSGDQLLVADWKLGVVYDVELNTPNHTTTTIDLNGSGQSNEGPVAIAMSPSGDYAYVTDNSGNAITVLKTTGTDQPYTFSSPVQSGSSLGLSAPHGAAVSPDGRSLYVADETGNAFDIYPISATTGHLSTTHVHLSIGTSPEDVAVSPQGGSVYVAVAGNGSGGAETAVVNPTTLGVTDVGTGPVPMNVAVTPDGSQFVVANNNFCSSPGSAWIYRSGQTTPSAKVNFTINGTPDTNPFDVAISPAFSAPTVAPQSIPSSELSGGGVNPSEVAAATGLNNVHAGVDTATGSYTLSLPGPGAASPGPPLDFAPTYDSQDAGTSGALGKGWSSPYAMEMAPPSSSDWCTYVVGQEDSSLAVFTDVAGSHPCPGTGQDPVTDFGPPARVQAALTSVPSCPGSSVTCYKFTRAGQTSYYFSTALGPPYPLVSVEDVFGNTLTLTYGGSGTCISSELSSVTSQGAGLSGSRTLTFTWGCGVADGNDAVTGVSDPLGRQASLTYDSAGDLALYTLSSPGDRVASHTFEFSYNGNDDLVNWWDPDNSSASTYPTLPAADAGTTVAYTDYSPTCSSPLTVHAAISVTGPEVTGQGVQGSSAYQPDTKVDDSAYDFCSGTGAVVVADPDQNVTPADPYSGSTTLDYYVGRALLSSTSGYGPDDSPVVDDNVGSPLDAASAVTVYVRDPLTLAAREVVDPDGNVTSTEWNALGDPVSVTDPNGGVTTRLYNPDNEVTELTEPPDSSDGESRTTTYTYSEPYLTAVTDPAGNVTRYVQAGSGGEAGDGATCAVLSPDAAAQEIQFNLDPNTHLPTCASTAGEAGVTTTTFDNYGDVATVTDPLGDVTSSATDLDGEVCGTLSPRGYVADGGPLTNCPAATGGQYLTVYPLYDVFGDVLQKATPQTSGSAGNVWQTYYDAGGRKLAAETPNDSSCDAQSPTSACEYATYYQYDAEGDLVSVADDYQGSGGPNVTTYTYDADGNKVSMVSPDGNVSGGNPSTYRTVYSYDDLDRLVATQDPQGSPSCDPQTTAHCAFVTYLAYNAAGQLVTSTTPPTAAATGGTTTLTSYDGDGNVVQVNVGNYVTLHVDSQTTSTYYLDDQVASTVPPDGYMSGQTASNWTTNYGYDQDGRISTVEAPAGEGTTSGAGAGAGTTWTFYDADGNKVAVTNGDGNGATCNASVDNPANPPVCADTTYYGYDLADRLTSVTGAAGQASATTTSYSLDADGNVHVLSNPSAVTSTYSYDSADEEIGVSYSDGTPAVSYSYNVDGTRASMSATGTGAYNFTYSYDMAQRLTGVANGSSTVAGYGYDSSGNVTSLTYPSGLVVSSSYLADDSLQKVSWGSSDQVAFSYDGAGELKTSTAQAGSGNPTVTTTGTYDDGDRLTDLSTTSSAQGNPLLVTNYSDSGNSNVAIDPDGNPTGEEVTTNGTPQPTLYYAVDPVDRANYQSTTAPSSRPVSASSQTYTYDKANFVTQGAQVAVQQYYGDGEIEAATSVPGGTGVSFSYDPQQDRTGESSTTSTTSYAFNAAGEMCWSAPTATIPTGGSTPPCGSPPTGATTYTYDGDGLRQSETTPTGTQGFSWDTESSVPRLLEDGQNDYVYGPSGTPVAQVALSGGAVDFLVSDREGSTRDVVSGSTGLSLAYTDYDVYGNPNTPGGVTAFTPCGFQGGYTDATGLVYFQQRYYDPGTAQFMSLDPLNAMTNAGYTFVNDDPLIGSDPSGTIGYRTCGESCEASGPPPPNIGPPSAPSAASSSSDMITTSSWQWMCNGTQCTTRLGLVTTSQPSLLAGREKPTTPALGVILGFFPDPAEVRAAAYASQIALVQNDAAVDAALTAPSSCWICSIGHFAVHHWRGELQIVGAVAAVVSLGTGGVAFFGAEEAATTALTAVSGVSSIVGGVAALPGCIANPSVQSCADVGIGIAGGGIAFGVLHAVSVAAEASAAVPLVASQAFAIGAGGVAWDAVNYIASR